MTTYNTGNPIGSKDPRDLYDNAENLDEAVNTRTAESWDDRFGVARKTWWGMEQDFQQFLINSGYQNIGDYGPGLEITARNQIFWRDGELYRAGAVLELPYTTTGDWGEEEGLFVAVGDQALRQEIGGQNGADLIPTVSKNIKNISLLRLNRSDGNPRAFVAGYYVEGDGGGGLYYLDPNDNVSEDNGGTIIVSADGGRWKLNHDGTVSAKQFGAIGNGVEDDSASINNALLSIALAGGGVLRLTRGNYYINSPLLVGPGVRIVGDGSTDALNNISPRIGTQITSGPISAAMRMLPAPMIDGWPDSEGGLSQGYSLKGVSFVSLDDHPGTAIELGPGGVGIETHLRNIYIEDLNTRNYLTGVEFLGAYEVTIKRFSIRGAGRPVGSSAFKFTAGVTSGSISDGAIYSLDSGIYLNSILVGFEIANIDFDSCNYCARSSGYTQGAVLRNLASEGTITSDFVFGHSGNIILDGFQNAGGVTANERVRLVGTGNLFLNNSLINVDDVPINKTAFSVENSGNMYFDHTVPLTRNPTHPYTVLGEGNFFFNNVPLPNVNAAGFSNRVGTHQESSMVIAIGDSLQDKTFVLDLDNFIGHGTVSISNSLTGVNESISWIIKRHDMFGTIQTGISKIETAPPSSFASATVFSADRIEITISDSLFNNSSVLITFPSNVKVRRTRLS